MMNSQNRSCFWVLLFLFFFGKTAPLHAQQAPSEQELNRILHQLQESNNYQRFKIAGLVKGWFTQKDQQDYVIWLSEDETAASNKKRQVIKLVWAATDRWEIASVARLPEGIIISKEHFVDITGDEILDFLYSYSYSNDVCVDGCAAISLKDSSIHVLYAQEETHACKQLDSTLAFGAELPYVSYKLKYNKDKKKLLESRHVKKYNGGTELQTILEEAFLDSSLMVLEYFPTLLFFDQPWVINCDSLNFVDDVLDERHPAVRLAIQHLNKNPNQPFVIEGVYRASFSQKNEVDFLFYSNIFTTGNKLQKRKAVKIVCVGNDWKVAGVAYIDAHFSQANIQDVDGNGLDEIIEESILTDKQQCTKIYQLSSFKGATTKLIYSHKNSAQNCFKETNSDTLDANQIVIEYEVSFEDVDQDGFKELVRRSATGQLIFKYDKQKEQFVELP